MKNLALIVTILVSYVAQAEPYISVKTQQACASCHVNPSGGGMRNSFGKTYGFYNLPASAAESNIFEFAKLSEYIDLGGDLRYNFDAAKNESSDETQSGFGIESAQFYAEIKAGRDDLTLYIDQQFAPGTALNREAFLLLTLDDGYYVKAGKFMPALGLKLEDDGAFTRQVTGFNFDNSDNGVEVGLTSGNGFYNLYLTNGNSAVTNQDNKFLFGSRAEFFLDEFRIGGAYTLNNGDLEDKHILAIFSGYHWNKMTLLAEVDSILIENSDGSVADINQLIGLVEVNYEVKQGHNVKLTSEYYDPNDDLKEDHRVRHSLIYEYTPISNIQLRFGARDSGAPPQFPEQNEERFFVQTHFYF